MKMMMLIDDAMLDAMLDMHPHCCVELRARAMAGARRCRPQRPPPPAARTGGGGGAGPGAGHATPRTGDGATTDAHAPRPRDERRTRYVPSADVRRLSTDAFIMIRLRPIEVRAIEHPIDRTSGARPSRSLVSAISIYLSVPIVASTSDRKCRRSPCCYVR